MNVSETESPTRRGMTLLEIIIVLFMLAILLALAYPGYTRQRARARNTTCVNNLRMIHHVKQLWALELGKSDNDIPAAAELAPFLRGGLRIKCPSIRGMPATFEDHYHIGSVAENPRCLIRPDDHVLYP